ncbi:MAG: hypothetical protein ACPKQO_02125 [Nitrososphaeraceae archaeon]
MSKTKIGVFSVLLFGAMMLLIPATSITNAQGYEDRYGKINDVYYEDNRYYYQDDNEYVYEEYYYPSKEDKKKEPPMLFVNKEVLYCDQIAIGNDTNCNENPPQEFPRFPGPNSNKWVQECSSMLCEDIDESLFDIKVENANVFEGSEKGTKLNFGERFNVIEQRSEGSQAFFTVDSPEFLIVAETACENAGFDSAFVDFIEFERETTFISCVNFEGECSGTIENSELKECTVKNYIAVVEGFS